MTTSAQKELREFVRITAREKAWRVEFIGRGDHFTNTCRYCDKTLDSIRDRAIVFGIVDKLKWPHRDDCKLLAMMKECGL